MDRCSVVIFGSRCLCLSTSVGRGGASRLQSKALGAAGGREVVRWLSEAAGAGASSAA
jgi:hypothetical protein